MKIVMISGKMGSGKSTLTRKLLELENQRGPAMELRFAEAIYDMHDFCRDYLKNCGIKVPDKDGKLLQLLGTDWGRASYGENVWVDIVKNSVIHAEGFSPQQLIVISDCRFMNEFDAFPEALRVRLVCGEDTRKNRAESWRENTQHPSEIDLDQYSFDKRFDLYIDTEKVDSNAAATLVRAQLDKNVWMEKRDGKLQVRIGEHDSRP